VPTDEVEHAGPLLLSSIAKTSEDNDMQENEGFDVDEECEHSVCNDSTSVMYELSNGDCRLLFTFCTLYSVSFRGFIFRSSFKSMHESVFVIKTFFLTNSFLNCLNIYASAFAT